MKRIWSDLGSKLGTGLCGAGILLVFLGWNGAASVDRVEAQFPYLISGGIAGLSLVVLGVGLIVVQNQRADRALLQQSLRQLEAAVRGEDPAATEFQPPAPRPTPPQYAINPQPERRRARRAPLRAEDA
ncbi:MAG: hypothetical protein ACLGIC_04230 [Acidimicrobiia bacterium]|jgi:hypothetical protein